MLRNKTQIRLYVPDALSPGSQLMLCERQSHYLAQVMRLRQGDMISVFNGEDGEWQAVITRQDKKHAYVTLAEQVRKQERGPDLWLVFTPIKGKTDIVVEKAVELGVSRLIPVITQRAVVRSVNMEKLRIHAIEAAEQCERLDVPAIEAARSLPDVLGGWEPSRHLLYADETGGGVPVRELLNGGISAKKAVLIGPEGGFSSDEQKLLKRQDFVKPFGMGPRILRADTASVAALACMQAWCGDWDKKPAFGA